MPLPDRALGAAAVLSILAACAGGSGTLPVAPFPDMASTHAPSCADRPAVLIRAEPYFPPTLMDAGQGGWVVLEYDILNDGSTTNINVVSSSPAEIFDGVSRRALREWKFGANAPKQKCRLDFKFAPRR